MVELKDKGEEIYRRLVDLDLFRDPERHDPAPEHGRITYGEGYPITAIEKFLGYYDKDLNIANFPSISFNTDFSVARTACLYTEEPGNDTVVLDGVGDRKYNDRAGKALNYFKDRFELKGSFHFYIKRDKKYSEAKGLGESAAVASSTARALVSNVFGDRAVDDAPFVSSLARMVSGSGSRSSMNGFSLWLSYPWIRQELSHGVSLPVDPSGFHFITFPDVHAIRTEGAHGLALSSPYYPRWMINKFDRIKEIIDSGFSIEEMMRHAENDMYFMHAVLMATGTVIHTPGSLGIINSIREFREKNEGVYYTSDTGPSLVLMSQDEKLLMEAAEHTGHEYIKGNVATSFSSTPHGAFMKEAEEFLLHK